MNVLLLRHGEALHEAQDPTRPLSQRGRADVRRMASLIGHMKIRTPIIYHSGKRRAEETALLVAEQMNPMPAVETLTGMTPMDDPELALETVEAVRSSVMLVGHLPHLDRLAGLLITGNPDREILELATATLVALGRETGIWRIRWMITPELLESLRGHPSNR